MTEEKKMGGGVHLVTARELKVMIGRKHGLHWFPLGKVGHILTPGLTPS